MNLGSLLSSQDSGRKLKLTNLEELDLSANLFNNSVFASLSGLLNLKSLSIRNNKLKGPLDIEDLSAFNHLEELEMSYNELNGFVARKGNKSTLRELKVLRLVSVSNTNATFTTLLDVVEAFPSVKIFDLSLNCFNMNTVATQELQVSSNVEELYLKSSYFLNNNILQSLGVLTSLRVLSLYKSTLIGTLPDQGWCNLRNLEELYIDFIGLQGNLPSCLSNLTSLRILDISRNQFTGNLTPLANLKLLRFLSLSNNHFQVPLSFISLTNLTDLKVLLSDENKLVMEPVFYTSLPKLQLKVISLSQCRADQQFTEEMAKFFFYQYDLRIVDQSYSNFSGTVPLWLLEKNTKLEALFLMGNSFTGTLLLPPLPHLILSSLDISNNKIRGQIPTKICSTFPYLERLLLSNNAFEGNIPPCLGNMSGLSFLDLSSNQLYGGVPKELTMNNSLLVLRLSNNNLSGKLVPKMFMSNKLLALYLDGNNFVGEIPQIDILGMDFSVSLYAIDLSNNGLSGKIPRWIWNLSSLEGLALSNNHFEGSIPMEVCRMVGLISLDLSQNNLSASIPSCFSSPLLEHVYLSGNRLSGSLPTAFCNCSSLVTLDLRGNNLTGNIPECIGTLSSFSILLLKGNHLEGGIPAQLCKLKSLSILDLSHNMFSGPILSCLGNLTLSLSIQKSSDGVAVFPLLPSQNLSKYMGMELSEEFYWLDTKRYIPGFYIKEEADFTTKNRFDSYKGDILVYMSGIDLSCNSLTGKIPVELGMLSEVRALNLSHNNLNGDIPMSFSNLKQIESLDLSYNNLTGKIPNQLVELNTLEVFSVAHNNLSGSTPERKAQFGTFDESSYEGNPLLCGPPLQNNCPRTDSPPTISTASDNEGDGGFLDTYVFRVSFLVTYVVVMLVIVAILYINPYWRRR